MLKHSWKMPYIYCNGTVFISHPWFKLVECQQSWIIQSWIPLPVLSSAPFRESDEAFSLLNFPSKRVRACSAGCTRRSTTSSTTSPRDRRRRRWGWRWWTESRESSTTCGPALRYLPHSPNTLPCSLCSPASFPLENSSCSWLLEIVKTQHTAWLGSNCWNNECFKKMLTTAQLLTLDATLYSLPWPS